MCVSMWLSSLGCYVNVKTLIYEREYQIECIGSNLIETCVIWAYVLNYDPRRVSCKNRCPIGRKGTIAYSSILVNFASVYFESL